MIVASTKFYPVRAEVDGFCFDLVLNPGLDLKTYRVRISFEEGLYSCSCNRFEMCGLICPHIIRVMVHLNVQQIPDRYMLRRWSAATTTPAPAPGTYGIRFGVPPTNTLKYNALCRKLNCLASDACYGDDTYEVVSNMADEASKVVAAMTRAREAVQQSEGEGSDLGAYENGPNGTQQQAAVQDEQNQISAPRRDGRLKNPIRVKPKGHPSNKEPRHKSLVELRDEANAKRRKSNEEPKQENKKAVKKPRKKRVKKCPFCHDEGHFIEDCPKAKDHFVKEAELAAGAELRL